MNRSFSATLIAPLLVSAGACVDRNPTAAEAVFPELPGVVISNANGVAYVSIAPRTYPGSPSAQIRNRSTNGARKVAMVNGGFDPVQVAAQRGDLLDLSIDAGGVTIPITVKVPAQRRPAVVRSNPPAGVADVVNSVSVIFSEPIERMTLTSASLRLLLDGEMLTGTIRLSEDGLTADFSPDTPLGFATYELFVSQDIRDLDGDALDAPFTVRFQNRLGEYWISQVHR